MKFFKVFLYDYRLFQLAYLNFRLHENAVFAFISVRKTITDLQTPKIL